MIFGQFTRKCLHQTEPFGLSVGGGGSLTEKAFGPANIPFIPFINIAPVIVMPPVLTSPPPPKPLHPCTFCSKR